MTSVQVFRYVEELDAFLVRPEFEELTERLGLDDWTPVVWMGRLFTLDKDYGEHWFDNWDEREALEERAAALGIDSFDLMILQTDPFRPPMDDPCHSPEVRRLFWTDVLKSLELSYDFLFTEARYAAARRSGRGLSADELEKRIQAIRDGLNTVPNPGASEVQ